MLLEFGADVGARSGTRGKILTPLTLAAKYGHVERMKLVLRSGASADLETWNACVEMAINDGHFPIVRFLFSDNSSILSLKRHKYFNGSHYGNMYQRAR